MNPPPSVSRFRIFDNQTSNSPNRTTGARRVCFRFFHRSPIQKPLISEAITHILTIYHPVILQNLPAGYTPHLCSPTMHPHAGSGPVSAPSSSHRSMYLCICTRVQHPRGESGCLINRACLFPKLCCTEPTNTVRAYIRLVQSHVLPV